MNPHRIFDVNNGNYQKFSLSNSKDEKVTRQYVFSYNNTKVTSSFSMFTALFANNTYSAIEKYLNFGKQSVNQLSSVDYSIINLNGDLRHGTLNVVNHLDGAHNIIKLSPDEMEQFCKPFVLKEVKKKQFLLRESEITGEMKW